MTVLKGLFADMPRTFAGEHYAISGLDSFPKPAQRPHPPIVMGGGKRGMLALAGRQADTVGLLTSAVGSGVVVADPAERLAAAVRQKLDWVRDGAGARARYDGLELSLIPGIYPADDRERRAAELIADNGWDATSVADVLAMPSMLLGTPDEMADDLARRREEYGFSYYVVSDDDAEAFAPVVARLAGR